MHRGLDEPQSDRKNRKSAMSKQDSVTRLWKSPLCQHQ